MPTQIYVNLPVKDLARSMAFFSQLGFGFDAEHTDDQAACMIVGENIYVMLLVDRFFATFTPKPVSDATKATEVLVCISADSREDVDTLVRKALAAGGTAPSPPKDYGFMYGHGFEDLDGHLWEVIYMEPDGTEEA